METKTWSWSSYRERYKLMQRGLNYLGDGGLFSVVCQA